MIVKKKIKGIDESIKEGVMSDLHLLINKSKSEQEFVKTFFKNYGKQVKKTPDSVEWAKELYSDMKNESVNEGISVFDERHFGKKGIIIMIDDNGKKVSAIFKNKKNADKYNRNKSSDLQTLLKLAKNTPYPKAIDESVNEAKEPEVITTLRKIVKNKQNDLIKDTKSGKKVRVDMNSANLMVQVYDALKQQSNKDKFVKSGIVMMGHMAYKLMKKESVNEGKYDGMLDVIEDLVSKAKSFMDVGNQLKKHKVKYSFSTSMIPMYKLDKLPIAIVNKKYVDKADREVGDIAIGLMESIKESVNELLVIVDKFDKNKQDYGKIYYRDGGMRPGDGDINKAKKELAKLSKKHKDLTLVSVGRNSKMYDVMGESVNEGKFYITRNLGRGQGKALVGGYDLKRDKKLPPKVFKSYKDAQKEVERLQRGGSMGGQMTAYYVTDKNMNPLKESVNEGKVHFEKKLKNGNIFQVIDRDMKGMRRPEKEDKFLMQIVDKKGKVVKHIGSHPSLSGAKKYSNSLNEDCWNGYKQVGGKMKNGKMVPNCVPEGLKESVMSDINMMSKQAKTLDDFLKKFFKEYGKQIKKSSDTISWATDLYNGVNEAKLGDIKKAVRNRPNPYSLVISRNGKVIDQVHIQNPNEAPAMFRVLKKKHPNDLVALEDSSGRILFTEYVQEYDVDTIEEAKDFVNFMKEYKSDINEAEYQGRDVKLGKPMQGDVKKFKVYVKNPKGNVVKVNFGHGGSSAKGKTMSIRKNNPDARKAFRARHNCDNPGPRHKARYWSCRKW